MGDAQAAEPVQEGRCNNKLSVARGREEVRKQRQKCANTLHYCCRQLCRPLNCRLWAVVAYAPRPLEEFFTDLVPRLMTKRGLRALMDDLLGGELSVVGCKLLRWLMSREFASHLEFCGEWSGKTAYQQQQDQSVALSALNFMIALVGNIVETCLQYKQPPFVFLGGLGSGSSLATWLADMRNSYEVGSRCFWVCGGLVAQRPIVWRTMCLAPSASWAICVSCCTP